MMQPHCNLASMLFGIVKRATAITCFSPIVEWVDLEAGLVFSFDIQGLKQQSQHKGNQHLGSISQGSGWESPSSDLLDGKARTDTSSQTRTNNNKDTNNRIISNNNNNNNNNNSNININDHDNDAARHLDTTSFPGIVGDTCSILKHVWLSLMMISVVPGYVLQPCECTTAKLLLQSFLRGGIRLGWLISFYKLCLIGVMFCK